MAIMQEIPEMPIIPPRGMGEEKISKLANLKISKCGGLEDSEGNGKVRKIAERGFGKKRV